MTCQQLLESKGIEPVIVRGNQLFYYSPFRKETKPSFTINTEIDAWYDFGAGMGGGIIQLDKLLDGVEIVKATDRTPITRKPSSELKILHITGLIDRSLIAYLKYRKIDIELARPYIHQLSISTNSRTQNVIGFKNDKGGYEMRNNYIKICSAPKWFTTILSENSDEYDIFEGFMDFLSYITIIKKPPTRNVIVLNSVSMIGKIRTKGKKLFFFGDNDEAGNATYARLVNCKDMRYAYKQYKDINDFLARGLNARSSR